MNLGVMKLQKSSTGSVVLYTVVIALFVVLTGAYVLRVWEGLQSEEAVMSDFKGYYAAAVLINNEQNPYDYGLAEQLVDCTNCRYRYLPFFAAVMTPFVKESPISAQQFWMISNQVFLVLTIFLSISLLRDRLPLWFILLAISAIMSFYPVWVNFVLGNVSMLLGFLVTLTDWFWQRDRRLLAGICLGIGITLKFYPGVLLVYFLWKKEYRIIIYSLVATAVLAILPDILLQQNLLSMYIESLTTTVNQETMGNESFVDNQSLNGFVARLYVLFTQNDLIPGFLFLLSLAVSGVIGLAGLFLIPRDRKASSPFTIIEYAALLLLFSIGIPNSWSHYYAWLVMLIPALLYLVWDYTKRNPGWKANGLILLTGLGFVFASQPYRIPRLLGIDAQLETLGLDAITVLFQSVLVYGLVALGVAAFVLLYFGRRQNEGFTEHTA